MQISVFGLGHAGAVTGACIADSGHDVIAVDTDAAKVRAIHAGRSPVVEPGLNELIGAVVARGLLRATTDYEEAVLNSELSLICVGTYGSEERSCKLDPLRSVCSQIGAVLRKKDRFHSVVLRSAVVPGTVRSVVLPVLEEASGKTAGVDFGFANSPWLLRESRALHDYFKPPPDNYWHAR